jgi:hypothetical protein
MPSLIMRKDGDITKDFCFTLEQNIRSVIDLYFPPHRTYMVRVPHDPPVTVAVHIIGNEKENFVINRMHGEEFYRLQLHAPHEEFSADFETTMRSLGFQRESS